MAAGERPDQRRLAALNNAEWCDAVCRAHGLSGRTTAAAWVQPRAGPAYYPNMVTLSPTGADEQLAAIEGLKSALPGGFSVTDSFAALDLGKHDFRALFDAEWIWRPPVGPVPPIEAPWIRIRREAELAEWESAWAVGSPAAMQVFRPSLLDDDRLAFFGTRRNGRIVAGCVANRSAEVVGLSNFFAPAEDAEPHRAAAVAIAANFAPELAIVGYEREPDVLADFAALGFAITGPLRVWLWDEAAG